MWTRRLKINAAGASWLDDDPEPRVATDAVTLAVTIDIVEQI